MVAVTLAAGTDAPARSAQLASQVAADALSPLFDGADLAQTYTRLRGSMAHPTCVEAFTGLLLHASELGLSGEQSIRLSVFCATWLAAWSSGCSAIERRFSPIELHQALAPQQVTSSRSGKLDPTLRRGSSRTGASSTSLQAIKPPTGLYALGPRRPRGPIRPDTSATTGSTLQLRFGRLPNNEVSIPSPEISRHHATLQWSNSTTSFLQERPTPNGSYVNGWRLTPREPVTVLAGDLLLCDTEAFLLL